MKISIAKTKICPFVQHVGIMGNFNIKDDVLDTNTPINVKCMTSNCMAWLYSKEYDFKVFHDEVKFKDQIEELLSDGYEKYSNSTDMHGTVRFKKELPADEKEGWCERLS